MNEEEKHNSVFELIEEECFVIKNYRDKNINKIDVLTHKQRQPHYQKFNKALSRGKR